MFHSNSAEFRKQTQFLYPIQRVFKGQAGTCSWNWVEASSRYVKRIGMRLSIFNFRDALFVFFLSRNFPSGTTHKKSIQNLVPLTK